MSRMEIPASPHHLSCRYDGLKRCQKHNMTYWSLRLTLTRKTSYSPYIKGIPKVVVAGYGHLTFRDEIFHEELDQLLVPSLANGYPNTLTHLYQCLTNAARLGVNGVVAEFGMFKGARRCFSRA
jgi:hypothetical protein